MANYRCIGRGLTDEHGVAHITETCSGTTLDHTGYKGAGIGELDIVASIYAPSQMNDSRLQSEIYEVLDCIAYDKCNTANTLWTLGSNSNAKLDLVDNSYRKLSEITTGTDAWVYLKIDHSCILEFDVQVSTNYSKPWGQYGQSANATTRRQITFPSEIRNGNWHHIKLSLEDGVATMTSPELSNPVTFTLSDYNASMDMYWRFRTDTDITEVNFKEFKYYPI